MKFMKSVLGVRANVVKEIVRVPARRIRADQRLAAIIEQGRFDALLPVRHHGIFGSVVAVFGEGGLVNHPALTPPPATNNQFPKGQEVGGAAIEWGDAGGVLELDSRKGSNIFV